MATNWVLFAAGDAAPEAPDAVVTRYTVERCQAVVGAGLEFKQGSPIWRVESSSPVEIGIGSKPAFRGTAQHLNYTSGPQRTDLEARSRGPFADPSGVNCVMIPIHKSDAWWQSPPEQRTAFFQKAAQHYQHVEIGARYVDRVYRKLYHSRYAGGAEALLPYDFITYFEFLDADREAFDELLTALRDTERNPEWAYVDREFEIWMRR